MYFVEGRLKEPSVLNPSARISRSLAARVYRCQSEHPEARKLRVRFYVPRTAQFDGGAGERARPIFPAYSPSTLGKTLMVISAPRGR